MESIFHYIVLMKGYVLLLKEIDFYQSPFLFGKERRETWKDSLQY